MKNKRKLHLIILVLLCTAAVFGAIGAVVQSIAVSKAESQDSQRAIHRWGGDMLYAQITAFISNDAGLGYTDMLMAGAVTDQKLTEGAISLPADAGKEAQLHLIGYSAAGTGSAKTNRGSCNVSITAIGGDFFYFHPMDFLNGSTFDPDGYLPDLAVIDENAAWKLFGAVDVTGMSFEISGETFVVSGVVSAPKDELTQSAYGSVPRIFISYSKFCRISGNSAITCYEALLPSPIASFGMGIVEKALSEIGVNSSNAEWIENSARYSISSLFTTLSGMAIRSMRTTSIVFPYWENVAGIVEDYLALYLLACCILYGIALLALFSGVVVFLKTHPIDPKKLLEKLDDKVDKIRTRGYYKKIAAQASGKEDGKTKIRHKKKKHLY